MFNNDTYETVQCRICGEMLLYVHDHHVRKHNKMTVPQYREMFPDAPTASQARLEQIKVNRHNANKGKPAHNKGKPASEEQKKKQSIVMKGRQTRLGAVLSDETKQKISDSLKKYEYTEEHRQSLRDAIRRKKDEGTYYYPLQNYKHTEEVRKRIKETSLISGEARSKQAMDQLKESIKKHNLEFVSNVGRRWKVLCKLCENIMEYDKQIFNPSKKPEKACPVCYPRLAGTSNGEQEVIDYIRSIYDGEILVNSYNVIKGFEVDIFIPEFSLGIEFDGLYWHSVNSNPKRREKHIWEKSQYAYKNNVKLIHIFSDGWEYNNDKVKDIISGTLKVSKAEIVNDYEIIKTDISNDDIETFILENSLKSIAECDIYYTVYYDNNIIGIGCFEKIDNNDYNLIEIIGKNNFNIKDLYSSILNSFVLDYDPNKIILYSDNRYWTEGKIYDKMNFQYKGITAPKLWYTLDYKTRINSDEFPDSSLEEMKNLGYDWIYDCGYTKWVWEKS